MDLNDKSGNCFVAFVKPVSPHRCRRGKKLISKGWSQALPLPPGPNKNSLWEKWNVWRCRCFITTLSFWRCWEDTNSGLNSTDLCCRKSCAGGFRCQITKVPKK